MERYEKYEDSGVEWVGEIPYGWEVKKLKRLIENLESGVSVNSTDFPASSDSYGILKTSCVYNYSFDPKENKEIWTSELIRAKINPRKGELIISRMNTPDLVGASGYVQKDYKNLFLPDRLWQTKFYKWLVLDTKWLSFVAKSLPFRRLLSILATGSSPSMKNLAQEDFLNIEVPFPNYQEQIAIANYLDHKTAEIDALIAQKERLIALYEEEKTAIINHVVTKGIDPNATLKDSGIDWLGDIPVGWEVKKLVRIVEKLTNGYVGPTREIMRESGIPYIQGMHIKNNSIKFTPNGNYYVGKEWSISHQKSILRVDDLLVVQTGTIGDVGIVKEEFDGANCHALLIVRSNKKYVLPIYFLYFLVSPIGFASLQKIKTGEILFHINGSKLKGIDVVLPPITEQTAIVHHIETETTRINTKIAKTERIIELQKEYRTALISEAVTGKIKVSHLAGAEVT